MQNAKKRVLFSTVAGLTLCVTLTTRMTSAQGPGGQDQAGNGQGQGGPGGAGQGRRGGGFGGQGGRGGFGGQSPFASGVITGGDANARTITIQSPFGGNPQTIQLGTTTQLVTQTTVTAADLKAGDQVQAQGVPTGIVASSITAGQMPTSLQGGGRGGPGGNRLGGPNNGGGPGDNNANDPNNPNNLNGGPNNGADGAQGANSRAAFAQATGRVVSTNPLTISLGNDVSLTIKMASQVRVTKISTVDFSNLKVGDRVTAAGQAGSDGKFNATGIGVNVTMGGMGMGGPGGGPPMQDGLGPGNGRGGPGGGPGGPGGPPDGPGGPGGPGE